MPSGTANRPNLLPSNTETDSISLTPIRYPPSRQTSTRAWRYPVTRWYTFSTSDVRGLSFPQLPTVSFACPIRAAFHAIYRGAILFSLPTHYENRIYSLESSSDVLESLTHDAGFTSDWKRTGSVCGILLSVFGSMLQIPRVVDSSLSTLLVVLALVCAFEGLLVSIVCYSHFTAIKYEGHAKVWVQNACSSFHAAKWWNVAVLMSIPAANIAWAVFFFVVGLLTLYACPQVICTMIDDVLERASDVGQPLLFGAFVLLRAIHVICIVLTLRRFHLRCHGENGTR